MMETNVSEPPLAFTTSQNPKLVIVAPNGRFDLSYTAGFVVEQQTKKLTVTRIDGTALHAEMPTGWIGTVHLERPEPHLRELVGGEGGPIAMYQYVTETDGSVSTYQYDGVTAAFPDATRMEFSAARRRRV